MKPRLRLKRYAPHLGLEHGPLGQQASAQPTEPPHIGYPETTREECQWLLFCMFGYDFTVYLRSLNISGKADSIINELVSSTLTLDCFLFRFVDICRDGQVG